VYNREQKLNFFTKAMAEPSVTTKADHGHPRGNQAQKKRTRQSIDHQHGHYYEHCQGSTKPKDFKAKL
jgi:hypothetical protein